MSKAELAAARCDKMKHISICVRDIGSGTLHEHDALELGVVLSGAINVWSQGSEYTVPAEGLFLFNAFESHAVSTASKEPARVLYMQISTAFCREYLARLSNVAFDGKALLSLPPQRADILRQRILSGALSYFQESMAFQLDCVGQTSLLLAELLRELPHRKLPDAETVVQKIHQSRSQRIADYIEQHYRQKLTLSDLAQVEGISAMYMSRVFGQLFHMPFQQYLVLLRLDKALPLLRDDSICLVDVCLECGFSDTKYLNTVCQKFLGCSASEYRREHADREVPALARIRRTGTAEPCYSNRDSLQILQQFLEDAAG